MNKTTKALNLLYSLAASYLRYKSGYRYYPVMPTQAFRTSTLNKYISTKINCSTTNSPFKSVVTTTSF